MVPEASFRLIYRLTPHLSLQGGYSFLYLNHAVRPGEQVGRVLVPAFGLPPASLDRTDFYAHGASVGLGLSF